jgi:hypothetical protein
LSEIVDSVMRPVCSAWLKKIQSALEHKKKKFQDDANECMQFFNGPYSFLYGPQQRDGIGGFVWRGGEEGGEIPKPTFEMTFNKVAELVQLFGPALYHRNPIRQVNPRHPPMVPIEAVGDQNDPAVLQFYEQVLQQAQQSLVTDKARSSLLEHYLNYTPTALDLKTHSRQAIDEAIIKGQGVLWTELYTPSGAGKRMIGSFYDTVDNLFIDPDMESQRDAKWIARRCIHPYWEVEKEYGLPPGSLKGSATMESYGQQAAVSTNPDGDYDRKRGVTNDLMVYYKVWSKMGAGGRLSGINDEWKDVLEGYGDYVYLVVAHSCPYPLNLPPQILETASDDDIQKRLEWPTPFWADDAWPFTPIKFHDVPREVWPMSHMKPGIGELKFLNWAYSLLAGKVRIACRDFLAVAKSAAEDLKTSLISGKDYTILQVEAMHQDIDKVVKFLQHPGFNPEIYNVIEKVTHTFEQRTGLTELMYGLSATQMRSAEEASLKGDQVSVRPDDMANKVEDAMTDVARKEALACRWHLTGADVVPVMGKVGAMFWDKLVTPSDPGEILHQLEYRIEANSTRKPNRARDTANYQQAMQTLLQPLFQYAGQSGNVGPINTLLTGWAKSIELDPTGLTLQPPPPPPAPGGPPPPSAPPQGAKR